MKTNPYVEVTDARIGGVEVRDVIYGGVPRGGKTFMRKILANITATAGETRN